MKRALLFLIADIIILTLYSCEKENDELYYVTYTVEGSSKRLSIWGVGGGAVYYINGNSVKLPYKETIGPVEKGYACSLSVSMEARNAQASFSAKIEVNGESVKRGGKSLYASGYNWQIASDHLVYIIE